MNNTKIDWCDKSWNPVVGCKNGCTYCYARRIDERFNKTKFTDIRYYAERLKEPYKLKKPQKIFVCSMSDLFGYWVHKCFINRVIRVCKENPQHTFMFLTKNPRRYNEFEFPDNCMLGISITNQEGMHHHSQDILEIKHHRVFLSIEPLLGHIALITERKYELIIVGAETGNRKDKVVPYSSWVEHIKEWCQKNGVSIFLKKSIKNV